MSKRPDKDFSVALVDGDILTYRASIASQDASQKDCADNLDKLMGYCLEETVGFALEGNYQVFLTGSSNFRYEIAKSHPYKGNRKDKEKPIHLSFARQYLTEEWGAVTIEEAEADDAIATAAVENADESVIVSVDKDFNTVPVWKYNFVTDTWRYDTEWTALKYFYGQVLTGDSADNIVGLYRVGPKTADKILADCKTEQDLYETCLKAYDGDVDRVIENARLLHLQRYRGELWAPPI